MKPIALVADAIRDVTHPGDIVIDAFCGSGTTILAAERTKRIGYAVELDPRYVDVSIHRWKALTGLDAILATSGQTFVEVDRERLREATPAPAKATPITIRKRSRPQQPN